jgi:hypothetical protein
LGHGVCCFGFSGGKHGFRPRQRLPAGWARYFGTHRCIFGTTNWSSLCLTECAQPASFVPPFGGSDHAPLTGSILRLRKSDGGRSLPSYLRWKPPPPVSKMEPDAHDPRQ